MRKLSGLLILFLAFMVPAHAQNVGQVVPDRIQVGTAVDGVSSPLELQSVLRIEPNESFGISDWSISTINASSMIPLASGVWQMSTSDIGAKYHESGNFAMTAAIDLPNGALVNGFSAWYDDTDPGQDIFFTIYRNNVTAGVTTLGSFATTGQPGRGVAYIAFPTPEVIDGWHNHYSVVVGSPSTLTTTQVRGITLWYMRQVAPAPASATFLDVPVGHAVHQYVEALVASGITAGCGSGNFCPNGTLTRGQMAVFLAKALGLHFDAYYFGF